MPSCWSEMTTCFGNKTLEDEMTILARYDLLPDSVLDFLVAVAGVIDRSLSTTRLRIELHSLRLEQNRRAQKRTQKARRSRMDPDNDTAVHMEIEHLNGEHKKSKSDISVPQYKELWESPAAR